MSEENKSVLRRFVNEVWNSGRLELIDMLVAPDYVSHVVHTPPIKNRDELKRWVADVRAAFPDVQFTIEDLLADDDKTIARWSSELMTTRPSPDGVPRRVTTGSFSAYLELGRERCVEE